MGASPLFDRINADLVTAMKAKDEAAVSALRMLKSALKYREVDLKRELKDEDVVEVLTRQAKQRKESIEGFEKGGRAESAAGERAELALIGKYLPAQMTEEEIEGLVAETVQAVGASSPRDMGKVMGALNPKVKGRADMAVVSRLVKAKLGA